MKLSFKLNWNKAKPNRTEPNQKQKLQPNKDKTYKSTYIITSIRIQFSRGLFRYRTRETIEKVSMPATTKIFFSYRRFHLINAMRGTQRATEYRAIEKDWERRVYFQFVAFVSWLLHFVVSYAWA